jgi:polar amino acid transport system permease protein
MVEFSTWDILRNLLVALQWTVVLSLIAFAGGAIVGSALLLLRLTRWRGAGTAVDLYVDLFQGTPLLMLFFLSYFGLGLFGIDVPLLLAATVALTLYASAHVTEIWRGCVESIPQGQWEAATSLALSFTQQLRYVVLPQAVRSVQVVKGTALASVIGFVELTKAGSMIANATFLPFTVYGFVALLYFALCYPLSLYARHLERSLHGRNR